MITEEQIQQVVNQIDNLKIESERLKENAFFLEWQKLKPVLINGQQVEQLLKTKEEHIVHFQKQASDLIKAFELQGKQSFGDTQQYQLTPEEYQKQWLQQQQMSSQSQQMDYVGQQSKQGGQIQQQQNVNSSIKQVNRPQQQPQQQSQQQSQQQTIEQKAGDIFSSENDELGINDELEIEGLPNFEELEELKK